jgi:hypothetical protein
MVRSCACGENWLSLCIREIHRWFATSQESAGHVAFQLQPPQASTGKPSPHGVLGTDGVAPAPPLELPLPELLPPEPPFDAELLAPLPVVMLVDAPMSLQYAGS